MTRRDFFLGLLGAAAGLIVGHALTPAPSKWAALMARHSRLNERMRTLLEADAKGHRSYAALEALLRRPHGFARYSALNGQR